MEGKRIEERIVPEVPLADSRVSRSSAPGRKQARQSSHSGLQKLVDRQIGSYDPICLGFGQGFPAVIAYYRPLPIQHLRGLEIMRNLLGAEYLMQGPIFLRVLILQNWSLLRSLGH